MNLFVRAAEHRRAREAVLQAGVTAVGVGTGFSGKRDGLVSFARRLLSRFDDATGPGGQAMATIRGRVHGMFGALRERMKG